MKYISLLLLASCSADAQLNTYPYQAGYTGTIKVMVIDTGVDIHNRSIKLCKDGHASYNGDLMDYHGHGTHISGLIQQYAGNGDYCIISCKYYDPNTTGQQNVSNMRRCEALAIQEHVNIINISGGGAGYDFAEAKLIKRVLDVGIIVVAAAGNERNDLSLEPYYPAQYDNRVIVVGSVNRYLHISYFSNYGKLVRFWELGENVLSILPNNLQGYMSGTSQACAIRTGKIVKQLTKH